MSEIPLISKALLSDNANVSAANRINVYVDNRSTDSKANLIIKHTPGSELFTDTGASVIRGIYYLNIYNTIYAVRGNEVITIDALGTINVIATLNSSDSTNTVYMIDNSKEIAISTTQAMYILNIDSEVITDVSSQVYVGGTLAYLNGRFITHRPNTGQFYISNIYDGLTWGALDYATAESNSDNLVSVFVDQGMLILLGQNSIEVWSPTDDLYFPFARVSATTQEIGLSNPNTLSRMGSNVIGMFVNKGGSKFIGVLNGNDTQNISGFDIDYIINNTDTSATTGFGYVLGGKSFYVLNLNSEKSFIYNLESGSWATLSSSGRNSRYFGDKVVSTGDRILITHYNSGKISKIDNDLVVENGISLIRELTLSHVHKAGQKRLRCNNLKLDFATGLDLPGDQAGLNLQISRDGGHTYGSELRHDTFGIGEYGKRIEFRKLGIARTYTFRIIVSKPTAFYLIKAFADLDELAG